MSPFQKSLASNVTCNSSVRKLFIPWRRWSVIQVLTCICACDLVWLVTCWQPVRNCNIRWTVGGWGAVIELRHVSPCHCVCVCVCPLHAPQGLATSRTVPQHPAEAPKGSELAAAPHVMDCYLCGRECDTRLLNKHEDECIKLWRKWNSSLPVDQRQPESKRPEFKFSKGHSYLLTYACIPGLCHRHVTPYIRSYVFVRTFTSNTSLPPDFLFMTLHLRMRGNKAGVVGGS